MVTQRVARAVALCALAALLILLVPSQPVLAATQAEPVVSVERPLEKQPAFPKARKVRKHR